MKEPEIIVPGILFVARDLLKNPDAIANDIMDETDGTWAFHRGFKGRLVDNRMTVRYGREGVTSTFGGKVKRKQKVYPFRKGMMLEQLADVLQHILDYPFNFVYCNLYLDGTAGISPHRDAGFKELPAITKIASLSFNQSRKFSLTNIRDKSDVRTVVLNPGDLAVMHGRCQLEWLHSVPREKTITEPRLSLTYRFHATLRDEVMK